jgi:hypothetical protein
MTSRPIPGKAPKKTAQRGGVQGSTSGKQSEPLPRRTRAQATHRQATPAIPSPETSSDGLGTESSVGSDDTIMREIDETAGASTGGEEGSSSPAVTILPRDPRAGTSSPKYRPRSPPPSFKGFVEETVLAAIAEGVECTNTSSAHPDPLPGFSEGPSAQLESTPSKRKGKEVVPTAEEGPERKKLRTDRDSEFMVSHILAMAKTFAPPRSHTLPAAIPSSEPGVPSHPQGSSANPSAPEETPVTERVQLQALAVGEEEQDDFSAEFAWLAEEVAFDKVPLRRLLSFLETLVQEPPRPNIVRDPLLLPSRVSSRKQSSPPLQKASSVLTPPRLIQILFPDFRRALRALHLNERGKRSSQLPKRAPSVKSFAQTVTVNSW